MKRLICLSLIAICFLICCMVNNSNFLTYSSELCSGYTIVINDNKCQVVELYDVELEDVIDKFNVEIVNILKDDNRVIIDGYSNLLRGGVKSNSRKINIQISLFDTKCIVGTPLILSSF